MRKITPIIAIVFLWVFLASCEYSQEAHKENLLQQDTQKEEITVEAVEVENREETILAYEQVLAEDMLDPTELIKEDSKQSITEYEKASLIHMREEEKLARDVYLTLYDIWGQKIFSNIAASEQTHTDAVKTLLSTYNIEDPVTDDTIWVFQIPEMQKLYDTLIAQWSLSLGDALTVWATIEDLDIYDIQQFKKDITNENILKVYDNLERGSRNHMRAFTKNLERQWLSYTPSYISQEHYQEIISSEQEKGNGMGMWGWYRWWKH